MAEKFEIYANGWGSEIYASHLKSGAWTITFTSDVGEYGRNRNSVRDIKSPKKFVHALYQSDDIQMDAHEVDVALKSLFKQSPAFSIACSIFSQMEDGETVFDEEDYLTIFPTLLSSNPQFQDNFDEAKAIGMSLFAALVECNRSQNFVQSVDIGGAIFPIVWDQKVNADLREFQISKAITEHCQKAEWKKFSGHSNAGFGNAHIGRKIRDFVSEYHSKHKAMPMGDWSVDGIAVKFN